MMKSKDKKMIKMSGSVHSKITYYYPNLDPEGDSCNNPTYQTYRIVEYDQWYFYYCL